MTALLWFAWGCLALSAVLQMVAPESGCTPRAISTEAACACVCDRETPPTDDAAELYP